MAAQQAQFSIRDLGQKVANPEASSTDFFRPSANDCDTCENVSPCKDSVSATVAGGITVTGIQLDGKDYLFPSAITASQPSAIQDAIETILLGVEKNVSATVTYTGGVLSISHVGQAVLNHVKIGGVNTAAARNCTIIKSCTFRSYAAGAITLNGVALPSSPYAYVGGPADLVVAADLAADILAALPLAQSVTATPDTVTQKYRIDIVSTSDLSATTVNGFTVVPCGCVETIA